MVLDPEASLKSVLYHFGRVSGCLEEESTMYLIEHVDRIRVTSVSHKSPSSSMGTS